MNGVKGAHEMHIDVGCYVVDALDATERHEFEAHLADCDNCAREVLEFTETAAELARLVAVEPPTAVRGATLTGIQTVRPLPPVVDRTTGLLAADFAPSAGGGTTSSGGRDELAERRARRANRRNRVLVALIAAAAVVAVAFGGLVVNLTQQQQSNIVARDTARRETELLAARDARVLTQTSNGARYTFVVSKQRNQALLLAGELPDPGPGKAFQLWTLQGRQATPDATMPVGSHSQWFTGPIDRSSTLAVTIEPAGGSRTPTMPILAQVSI